MRRSSSRLSVLSARELQVLERLAGGLSNAAIAGDLCVSERTVDAHVRSIFSKLDLAPDADVNRRVQATLAWLQAADAQPKSALAPMLARTADPSVAVLPTFGGCNGRTTHMRRALLLIWAGTAVPFVLTILNGGPDGWLPHLLFHPVYIAFLALAFWGCESCGGSAGPDWCGAWPPCWASPLRRP